jgi:hypothetical protein
VLYSTDGTHLVWVDGIPKRARAIFADLADPGMSWTSSLSNARILSVDGDRVAYSDSLGTYIADVRSGVIEETISDLSYSAASSGLSDLFRLTGFSPHLGITATDEPRCVHVLSRATGVERRLFCIKGDPPVGSFADLRADPESGRLAVVYWTADRSGSVLETFDPDQQTSDVTMTNSAFMHAGWAGGRLYVKKNGTGEFTRFDPKSGQVEPIDVAAPLAEAGVIDSFYLAVSPDERAIALLGRIRPSENDLEIFVIPDPLAGE